MLVSRVKLVVRGSGLLSAGTVFLRVPRRRTRSESSVGACASCLRPRFLRPLRVELGALPSPSVRRSPLPEGSSAVDANRARTAASSRPSAANAPARYDTALRAARRLDTRRAMEVAQHSSLTDESRTADRWASIEAKVVLASRSQRKVKTRSENLKPNFSPLNYGTTGTLLADLR